MLVMETQAEFNLHKREQSLLLEIAKRIDYLIAPRQVDLSQ